MWGLLSWQIYVNLVCVQFNGFCLCEVNHSITGHKAQRGVPTTTLLWLAHAHNREQASWRTYILVSSVDSRTNLASLFLPDVLWQGPPFQNVNAQSWKMEWAIGKREERENLSEGVRKVGASFFLQCPALNNPKPTKIGGEGREGGQRRGGSRGAYVEGSRWRPCLIRRELWVSVVAGYGSSCLGGGLKCTVCLSKIVRLASITVCMVSFYNDDSDDGMDSFTHCSEFLLLIFFTIILNYPLTIFRNII